MGAILFIILASLELGLCVWTLAKHKEEEKWVKNRLLVTGVQWGVIAFLLLLPIGNKGLRLGGCFVILGIRLLIDVIRFVKKRKQGAAATKQGTHMMAEGTPVTEQGTPAKREGQLRGKGKTILAAVTGCIVIAVSLFPAFAFTGYQSLPVTGAYEVGMVSAILTDETRLESFETDGSHREVPIYVFYPKKQGEEKGAGDDLPDGSFPLVLFSHGAFGFYGSNLSTYEELASHGYVVISMDHPYHSFFTKDTAGKMVLVDRNFMQSVMTNGNAEDGEIPEEEIFQASRDWMNLRIADVNFVLDEIGKTKGILDQNWYVGKDADAQVLIQILSKIDHDKIGMMGHSLGGATSVTIGRTRGDVKAVIDLDGTMLGEELSCEDGQYQYYEEAYPVPLLMLSNENHHEDFQQYGTLYVNGLVLANAKDASYTYFKGSGHMNFTDLPLFSPFLASLLGTGDVDAKECIQTVNELTLQFFDHYLKGQGEFQIQESY
ncbi:MAG: hypothetical protein IK081_14240 [Lachnospiraceae bacterium]|nr:hypothetical protein [Lachnospiraceae bacterium]